MSIFDLCPPAADGDKIDYFNFKNIGDSIEGTLVEILKDKKGKWGPQDLYGIRVADGTVKYVAAKQSSQAFCNLMRQLNLGQIIGLKYTKDIPTNNGNPFKFVHLAQDPSIMDAAWVAENEGRKAKLMAEFGSATAPAQTATETVVSAPVAPVAPVAPAPVAAAPVVEAPIEMPNLEPVTPVAPVMTDQEKTLKVAQIIRDRFGLTAGEEIKAKVTELTALPMITANLDQILAKLAA